MAQFSRGGGVRRIWKLGLLEGRAQEAAPGHAA